LAHFADEKIEMSVRGVMRMLSAIGNGGGGTERFEGGFGPLAGETNDGITCSRKNLQALSVRRVSIY
jgi:hypothetical protein